jgi:hypothetical protein
MSTTKTPAKERYYSPSVQVDAEVCLSEFSTRQLDKELAHRRGPGGEQECTEESCGSDGVYLSCESLYQIRTLLICGQRASALECINDLLEPALGRRLL